MAFLAFKQFCTGNIYFQILHIIPLNWATLHIDSTKRTPNPILFPVNEHIWWRVCFHVKYSSYWLACIHFIFHRTALYPVSNLWWYIHKDQFPHASVSVCELHCSVPLIIYMPCHKLESHIDCLFFVNVYIPQANLLGRLMISKRLFITTVVF